MMEGPNPFCTTLPTQLRAWDATALKLYMECPRKYQYAMVQGWRGAGETVHLEFGSFYHAALDTFDKVRAAGGSSEDALDAAIDYAMTATTTNGVFWGGEYRTQWRCTGKIGRKKCPYSKKWHEGARPQETCGTCSHPIDERVNWIPYNKYKNRITLLRSIVAYADEQPDEGGVKTLVFPDGKAASELSFRLDLPFLCPDGSPYILCGNLDGMVTFGGEVAPRERKTTKNSIEDYGSGHRSYWDQWAPNVQVDTYDLAADLMFGDTLKSRGVMMEATQVTVGETRVKRKMIYVPPERREEWFGELEYWIKRAEQDAKAGYYPKNTASCSNGGGCPYAGICRLAPSSRERFMAGSYTQNPWNPLAER